MKSFLYCLAIAASVISCSPRVVTSVPRTYSPVRTPDNVAAVTVSTDSSEVRNLTSTSGRYQNPTTPAYSDPFEPELQTIEPGMSFRAYTGVGRRINKIASELDIYQKQHLKRLLTGWVFGLDGTYFMESGYGVGFRYQTMYSSSDDYAVADNGDGTFSEGILKDKMYITFLGPVFAGRADSKDGKHMFVINVGIGALMFRDLSTFRTVEETISGNTLGFSYNFSYSYRFTRNLSFGADLSYITGSLGELTYKTGYTTRTVTLSNDKREGLAHLTLSAGVRYTF